MIENKVDFSKHNPLIAILRGIKSYEVLEVTQCLIEEGFGMIEVPLNSPNAIHSIQLLVDTFGHKCLIGAGTVTTEREADSVIETGAKLIVTPNFNRRVVEMSRASGCITFPGVITPSEAFSALESGADGLKVFPVSMVGLEGFKALKSVLPKGIPCFPVGGITPDVGSMKPYIDAGASGFGLGSALYKAGMSVAEVKETARAFMGVYNNL